MVVWPKLDLRLASLSSPISELTAHSGIDRFQLVNQHYLIWIQTHNTRRVDFFLSIHNSVDRRRIGISESSSILVAMFFSFQTYFSLIGGLRPKKVYSHSNLSTLQRMICPLKRWWGPWSVVTLSMLMISPFTFIPLYIFCNVFLKMFSE